MDTQTTRHDRRESGRAEAGTTTEPMRENSVNFLFLGALSSVKEDNLLITAEPRNPVNN
jgi:hypothetical protein